MKADHYDWQPDRMAYLMQMRVEFGLSLTTRRVVESDPAEWSMPPVLVRRPRELPSALWRVVRNHVWRMGRIVAYEHRKASGTLRYHADPKSMAIITGITS